MDCNCNHSCKFNVDDLVEKGLVKKKTYTEGQFEGLSVLKYTRSVFFKNLWNEDPRLLDCRGIVVDDQDNIVSYPFTKCFNLYENNTIVNNEKIIVAPRKLNGYMATLSVYKDTLLVATTGTLDSDYAKLAKKVILNVLKNEHKLLEGFTYIFEICDPSDPHIVEEDAGAYLIGFRNNSIGSLMWSESCLDEISKIHGFKRPEWEVTRFDKLKKKSEECLHEGYMVRDTCTGDILCKIKSKHYINKKALMRLGKGRVTDMYRDPSKFKERLDEEFYEIFDYIVENYTENEYNNLTEQQRRNLIEEYFNND